MKKRFWLMAFALVIFLAGALFVRTYSRQELLAEYHLNQQDVKSLVTQLEKNEFPAEVSASITDQVVRLSIKQHNYRFNLPTNTRYVAFAPYLMRTHECYTHSLTGCQGELVDTLIAVDIYTLTGDVISSNVYNTGKDGFIGLFLATDQSYQVVLTYQNKVASFIVEAGVAQTCFTDLRLA